MPFPNNGSGGLHAALFPQSTDLDGLVNEFLDTINPARGLARGIRPAMPQTMHLHLGSNDDEPRKPQPGEPGYDPDPGIHAPFGIGGDDPGMVPIPLAPPDYSSPEDYHDWVLRPGGPPPRYEYLSSNDSTSGSNTTTPGNLSKPSGLASIGNGAGGFLNSGWHGGSPDWQSPGKLTSVNGFQPSQQGNVNEPSPASGPSKASSFMDPRTGKVDYWKWLDAGAARIGQGGTVLEDDSPEFMMQNGIMNKPAALLSAGAPGNVPASRDSFVQDGPPGQNGNPARQVTCRRARTGEGLAKLPDSLQGV